MLGLRGWVGAVAAACAVGVSSSAYGVQAFGPILLTDYEFVPDASSLHLTGGFAGFDETFQIVGGFSFASGLDYTYERNDDGQIVIGLAPFADFFEVDAVAVSNEFDWSFDLDQALNLSGLNGSYEHGFPSSFEFNGVDGQGAPMHVSVMRKGEWLMMHGSNDPGCCDFFNYEFEAVARQVRHDPFSFTRSRGGGAGGAASGAVPEPATAGLMLIGGLALLRRRRG